MEPIYPLTEEHLDRYRGQLVCVVMQDGTRHVGVLSRCRGGRLVLNDDEAYPEGDGLQAEAAGRRSGRRRTRRKRTPRLQQGSAVSDADAFAAGYAGGPDGFHGPYSGGYRPVPYRPFGPRLLLDLALIALVLLIL